MELLYVESQVSGYGLDHYLWKCAIFDLGSQTLSFGILFLLCFSFLWPSLCIFVSGNICGT